MTALLSHLLDVSIRSLALAMVAFALLRIRTLRTAAWAHAIWTAVLLGMLFLFALGSVFKPIPVRILPAPQASVAEERAGLAVIPLQPAWGSSVPFVHQTIAAPAPRRSLTPAGIAVSVYAAVAIALLVRLLVGSSLARRLVARSVPAGGTFYESTQIAIPLTIGWLRPVIVLPPSWRTWDRWKLEAVLLHESSHVRRRDSLVSLLAGLNQCLFWFHPLAWWLERKLAFLAERACDEACVCKLESRPEYARLLVEMAGAIKAPHGRILPHALAMARPSQIHQRIEAILDDTRSGHPGLNAFSWTAVLLSGIVVVSAAGSMRFEPKLPPPIFSTAPAEAVALPHGIRSLNPPIARRQPLLVAQAPVEAPQQQPDIVPPQPDNDVAESLIVLPVSVVEPAGRYVTGLKDTDFRITEGSYDRPITSFGLAAGQHAIAVLNTIGPSGDAMAEFQKALDPSDESFTLAGPPATNVEAFMDAISAAVSEVKQRQNPVKAVVVIMQGGRNHPWAPVKNVAGVLRLALHTPRVAIVFASLEDITEAAPLSSFSQQDDMRILAGSTGGQVFPVARPEEIATAVKRIGTALRYQYLLGFVRSNFPPGSLARPSIETTANGTPRLQVISPLAYGK